MTNPTQILSRMMGRGMKIPRISKVPNPDKYSKNNKNSNKVWFINLDTDPYGPNLGFNNEEEAIEYSKRTGTQLGKFVEHSGHGAFQNVDTGKSASVINIVTRKDINANIVRAVKKNR